MGIAARFTGIYDFDPLNGGKMMKWVPFRYCDADEDSHRVRDIDQKKGLI